MHFILVKQIKVLKVDTKNAVLIKKIKKYASHSNFMIHVFENNHVISININT